MKICHILEASGGGSGRVVLDLVAAGLRAGDDVTLIYSPLRSEARFVEEAHSFSRRICIHALPMTRSVGFQDAVAAFKLWRLLRKTGPFDVLHAHSSKAGGLVRLIGVLFPRSVKIYTPHAFVSLAPGASRLYGMIERFLSFFGDKIIAVSALEKRHAVSVLGINPNKIAVVANGINPDYPATRASAREALRLEADAKVVGFVGRFVPQKNPQRLLETIALVHAKRPDIRFIVIGDGDLSADVKADVESRGLSTCVRLLGGRDARTLMPAFDCLLCTSDYEAFPIVFLEALFAETPIVTTPVGGAEECVLADKSGLVTDTFSSGELAKAVLQIMAMDDLQRARMQRAIRLHATSFSVYAMNAHLRAIYEEALEAKRS